MVTGQQAATPVGLCHFRLCPVALGKDLSWRPWALSSQVRSHRVHTQDGCQQGRRERAVRQCLGVCQMALVVA